MPSSIRRRRRLGGQQYPPPPRPSWLWTRSRVEAPSRRPSQPRPIAAPRPLRAVCESVGSAASPVSGLDFPGDLSGLSVYVVAFTRKVCLCDCACLCMLWFCVRHRHWTGALRTRAGGGGGGGGSGAGGGNGLLSLMCCGGGNLDGGGVVADDWFVHLGPSSLPPRRRLRAGRPHTLASGATARCDVPPAPNRYKGAGGSPDDCVLYMRWEGGEREGAPDGFHSL